MIKLILYDLCLLALAYWCFRRVVSKEYLGTVLTAKHWSEFPISVGSTVATAALFYFPPRYMIAYGFSQSVWVGIGSLLVFACWMIFVIIDLHKANRNETTGLVDIVNVTVATVLLGVHLCSALSFALSSLGLAHYSGGGELNYGAFVGLYLWRSIDLIPLVKVWELLKVSAPLSVENVWAGVPVLLFELFMILQVIKSIRAWIDQRARRHERLEKS